jgi:hypothetical protein
MFLITPTETVKVLGTWPMVTLHKGRKYKAVDATNQPDKGAVFATSAKGESVLLRMGEFKRV